MKTNGLLILLLVLKVSVSPAQPQVAGQLTEGIYVNSAIDVNGQLAFSEHNRLYVSPPQYGYIEEIFNVGAHGAVENLKNVNGTLYFTTLSENNETALWKSSLIYNDGMYEGNTQSVVRFTGTYNQISPLANIGHIVYFGFEDKLYRTDGTEGGTTLIKDLDALGDRGLLRLREVHNTIFISVRKGSGRYELWKSDGSDEGTSFIKAFRQLEFLDNTTDALFFAADDGSTGIELWKVATTGTTSLVRDINVGGESSLQPDGNIAAAGANALVFSTETPAATWIHTTTLVQLASISASEIAYAGGFYYFIRMNELWRSNGTSAGTALLKTFPQSNNPHARLSNLTAVGETVFFSVDGMQLWQSDGIATIRIYDHTPSSLEPAGTMDLVEVGDQLYYFGGVTQNAEWFDYPSVYHYNPAAVWVPSLQLVDATTNEDIRYLDNNAVVYTNQNISIRADASLATSSVLFHIEGVERRREKKRPFSIAGDNNGDYNAWNIPPGVYNLQVTPFSSSGSPGSALTYSLSVVDPVQGCGVGTITRQFWNNIKGNQIVRPGYRPTGSESLNSFEGPTNAGINYVSRIDGYVCPPLTGEYTFWIASNDHSELWLSTDEDARNKVKIASISGATNPREWDKFKSQKSAPIQLQAGTQYYIAALHKQGSGTDNLAVGWQLPNGEMERPIPGNRLSPFTGNRPPDVIIVSPVDGQVYTAPASIFIQVETPDSDGFVERVELFAGSRKLSEYYHQFEWQNVPPGAYEIYARAIDGFGAITTSASVNVIVTGSCNASGTITREYWSGVAGSKVSDIPVTRAPSGETELSLFEGPQNSGTNYGARVKGFICPPSSGDYIFWIASNDHSELWVSTDEDPANKIRVANVTGATNSRQWNKFSSQKSSPVSLVAGKKYYIEALHKQGVGTDHLAVGWQLPDGTMERPIGGNRLSPFSENNGAVSYMVYPADGTDEVDPLVMKLRAEPVIGARRYTVEINSNADFAGPSKLLHSVEDYQTVFISKDLEHATTYYVRVRTDVSDFGPVKEFTTRNPIGLHRLWGLATAGGEDDMGTIFSFSIDSSHFVKHYDKEILRHEWGEGEGEYEEFPERLHATPVAGPDGTLYGQAYDEYNSDLFVMDKEGTVQWLSPFLWMHYGNLTLASNNNLYVTTEPYLIGGSISRYPIDDHNMTSIIRTFNQKEYGLDPSATLIEVGEYLYGTTMGGGINNGGVVYRIRHDGTGFQVIHYFGDVYGGRTPVSGLTEAEGFIYGTTSLGGAAGNMGTIFRMKPDGSDFSKLHNFDGSDGRHPTGEVIVVDDVVFGMTSKGGSADRGTVYRVGADGSGFAKLHDFSGLDGDTPSGALTRDSERSLYGMTTGGGGNDMGVIFTLRRDGTGFTKLFDFTPASGGRAEGSLVFREDTFSSPEAMTVQGEDASPIFSIHPNPTTDAFNIHIKSMRTEKAQLVITDQYGVIVSSYEIVNDTPMQFGADLKRGLYIVKVMQGNAVTMTRLVKN